MSTPLAFTTTTAVLRGHSANRIAEWEIFTLPCGYVDTQGNLHREGVMRRATRAR